MTKTNSLVEQAALSERLRGIDTDITPVSDLMQGVSSQTHELTSDAHGDSKIEHEER